jgi:hypothetical protein
MLDFDIPVASAAVEVRQHTEAAHEESNSQQAGGNCFDGMVVNEH